MKTSRGRVLTLGAAALGMAVLGGGVQRIYAAASADSGATGLVQALATKFNLKTSDVQQVFDEHRVSMQANRQAAEKTRLDQAVKDGKLTQAKEDLIIAKQAEMQKLRDSLKDKTESERRTAMETQMQELKKWATDNAIPEEYLRPGFGKHGGGRPHMGGMR